MGLNIVCDGGCGYKGSEFKKFGLVNETYYCPECAPSVDAYYSAINDIHTEMVDLWESKSKSAKESWLSQHEGGILPDQE